MVSISVQHGARSEFRQMLPMQLGTRDAVVSGSYQPLTAPARTGTGGYAQVCAVPRQRRPGPPGPACEQNKYAQGMRGTMGAGVAPRSGSKNRLGEKTKNA